ncbi:chemotaxis protein CheX [Desulfurivibrio sp. D14AmB]|uniref:chemotaxis protein CheX n=1 Tax=Desulfurivibrio sp. D14AmB TaxID=3374370 RepID=UPI00376F43A2
MDGQFRSLIFQTFGEVFETMFFTFLEPVDEIPGPEALVCDDTYIRADIAYQGPQSGRFTIYLPKRLAHNVTMNFLGADEAAISDEQMLDTAKEATNMAVGSLLGKIDPAGESKLNIPEAMILDHFAGAEVAKEPGAFLFDTDYGRLWVVFN